MSASRPKRLFRARRREPSSFNTAMLEVISEDLIASPCVTCDQPGKFVGVWQPAPECIAAELDGNPRNDRRPSIGCASRVLDDARRKRDS
jgi:hypothetical protein